MKRILPTIVISQFFCTSLWFAGNAVMPEIARQLNLTPAYLVHLSSAVQIGFITGTLIFAMLGIADRYRPTLLFLGSAIIAALLNLVISADGLTLNGLMITRFLIGFFLAGIYPMGMKIASDHYQKGLGKSLGYLVGALALGTSFAHFLKFATNGLPWRSVIYATSVLALIGGAAMYVLVPDGPFRTRGQFRWGAFLEGFRNSKFRGAAFGYFGHMWELYAFWVFVPVFLSFWQTHHPDTALNISLLSFLIIAAGSIACVIAGYLSQSFGSKPVAAGALALSGLCCLASPLFLVASSPVALLVFLFFWSMVVIADSPLFSTLVAQSAPDESKGSALTVVTCIGFAVTIVSIQLVSAIRTQANSQFIYMMLAAGPVFGLAAMARNRDGI